MTTNRKKWYFNVPKERVTDVPNDINDKYIGSFQRKTAIIYCKMHNFTLTELKPIHYEKT